MAEKKKLDEIAAQLGEDILAVKGTLEIMDTSVTEEDLHELLMKALERMDVIQRVSNEMLAFLRNCLDKMDELHKSQSPPPPSQ
jgi:BMFP domain-containing protein YqiC